MLFGCKNGTSPQSLVTFLTILLYRYLFFGSGYPLTLIILRTAYTVFLLNTVVFAYQYGT